MKKFSILIALILVTLIVVGCSANEDSTSPNFEAETTAISQINSQQDASLQATANLPATQPLPSHLPSTPLPLAASGDVQMTANAITQSSGGQGSSGSNIVPTNLPTFEPTQVAMAAESGDDSVGQRTTFVPPADIPSPAPTAAAAGTQPPSIVETEEEAPPEDMTFENPGTNPFFDTATDNLSTFAMDVDTASYTVARNYLMNYNQMPPTDAIRPEEFINYFGVSYNPPSGDNAFAIQMDAAPAPFGENDDHYLMRVGIQGKYIAPEDRTPVLLIFVIDVSGSMDMENRLGLVKEALALLVGELREDDRVGIAVYSDNSRVVLEPTPASEADTIMQAINTLRPEGSTNVESGLNLGYTMANAHRRDDEGTRVIILSDGVANVGSTQAENILNTVSEGVASGIDLSTIGFGMGNYNDVLMERLANDGNGNYYYVDNLREARRIFVNGLTSTLQVIGYDARIQVDFNPDVTARYRLIGYENREIADADFRNDAEVDAAEIGAGHSITALYEVVLHDDAEGNIATTYVRYEDGETRDVVEINADFSTDDVMADMNEAPMSFFIQACIAEFGELLRGSYWAREGSYADVLAMMEAVEAEVAGDPQIDEFMQMVRLAANFDQ